MKTKYNFYVKYGEEVDIPRITKEAPPEVDAILLVSDNAALMLRQDFLDRFKTCDEQSVAGKPLEKNWGWGYLEALDRKSEVFFSRATTTLSGWRTTVFDKEDIEGVLKQLEAARSYVPHREVRVSYV